MLQTAFRQEVNVYVSSQSSNRRRSLIPRFGGGGRDDDESSQNGQWIRCQVDLSGSILRIQSSQRRDQYSSKLILTKSTRCFRLEFEGRTHCLALYGFKGAHGRTKRYFDLGSKKRVDAWLQTMEPFVGAVDDGKCLPRARRPSSNRSRSRSPSTSPSHRSSKNSNRPPSVDFSSSEKRWNRAIEYARIEVRRKRLRETGFSAKELIQIMIRVRTLAARHNLHIKFKVRRMLTLLARAYAKKRRAVLAWNAARSRRFERMLASSSSSQRRGLYLDDEEYHHEIPPIYSGGSGHHFLHHVLDTRSFIVGKNNEQKIPLDRSAFRLDYAYLLKRERLWPMLVRTLHDGHHRAKMDRDPGHALRCLMAIRVARMVLSTRGGLAACLDAGLEQRSLEYFFAAGLYSKIPVLVSSVLDMLTGLVQVPGRGASTVKNVLEFIDRITKWNKPLCSSMPIVRTSQARESQCHLIPKHKQKNDKPPAFAALAVLLNDSPDHDCCVDLKPNVVALMAAFCHAEPTPAAAQWMRARIFHACRAVLVISHQSNSRPSTPRGSDGSTAAGIFSNDKAKPQLVERLSTSSTRRGSKISDLSERHSSASKRAKRRRSVIGLRRGSLVKRKPNLEAVFGSVGDGEYDLSSSDDDSDGSNFGTNSLRISIDDGSGGSNGDLSTAINTDDEYKNESARELLHPCPPLAALARRKQSLDSSGRDEVDWHFLRLQLERFLDAWDLHELNEVEGGLNLSQASEERYEMYFERIRRSALLLGPAERLDSLLAALGLDLEHAAALPGFMAAQERQQLQERGSLVLDADASWRALKRIDKNLSQLFAAKPRTIGDHVMADETPMDHLKRSLTYLHAGDSLLSSSKAKGNASTTESDNNNVKSPPVVEDPRLAKYKKMLAMHIPAVAVAMKMRAEGMDPSALGLENDSSRAIDTNASAAAATTTTTSTDDAALFLPEPELKPHGCSRKPGKKTRRVFLDAVPEKHTKGTFWHDLNEDDEHLQDEALSELEHLFRSAPGKNINEAFGEKSKVTAAQEAALQIVSENKEDSKRSLVAEAIGERRAFALSLSWGSLRMSAEEIVKAIATLDPDGKALLSKVQRLNTLYVMLSSVTDLESIEKTVHEADDVDDSTLDEVSIAFKGLVQAAKRPRAKVRLLHLYATVSERTNGVLTAVKDYHSAALNVRGSGALRKIMGCVLAVANFVNHGSQRGMARGVRVAALAQLRSTRMTKNEPYKNMLQFIAEYAGVSPQLLEEELEPKLLRRVAEGMERSAIQNEIEQLHEERDAASQEHALLASECDSQSGASSEDALRIAFTAIAATRAAQIVADIDSQLEHLERAYDAMDDDVNALLQTFGEAVVITASDNATKWFGDLVTFVTHYTAEHAELREAAARRTKREQLVKKASARDVLLESGTVAPRRRRSGFNADIPSSPVPSSVNKAISTGRSSSAIMFRSTPTPIEQTASKKPRSFHSGVSPQQVENSRRNSSSSIPYDLPPPAADPHFFSTTTPRNGTICVDCNLNDRASCPGAYAISDGFWYCGDCWHRLSLVDANWRNDFGDETYPFDDIGDSGECPTDEWLNNEGISGSIDDGGNDQSQTDSGGFGNDSSSTRLSSQYSVGSQGSTESENKYTLEESRSARSRAALHALRLPSRLRGNNEGDRASSSANSQPPSPSSSKSRSPKGQQNRAGRFGRNLRDLAKSAKSAIRKKTDYEQTPTKVESASKDEDDLDDGMTSFMRVSNTISESPPKPDEEPLSIDDELEFRRKQVEAARKRRAQQITNNAVANGESSLLAFWTNSGVVDHNKTTRGEPRRPATTTHAGFRSTNKGLHFREIPRPATSTNASRATPNTEDEQNQDRTSTINKKRASYTIASTKGSDDIPDIIEAKSPLYQSHSVFCDAVSSRNSSESGASPIVLSDKELKKLNMSRQNMSVEDPEFYLQPVTDPFIQITSNTSSPCNSLTEADSRNSMVDLESRSSSGFFDDDEMLRIYKSEQNKPNSISSIDVDIADGEDNNISEASNQNLGDDVPQSVTDIMSKLDGELERLEKKTSGKSTESKKGSFSIDVANTIVNNVGQSSNYSLPTESVTKDEETGPSSGDSISEDVPESVLDVLSRLEGEVQRIEKSSMRNSSNKNLSSNVEVAAYNYESFPLSTAAGITTSNHATDNTLKEGSDEAANFVSDITSKLDGRSQQLDSVRRLPFSAHNNDDETVNKKLFFNTNKRVENDYIQAAAPLVTSNNMDYKLQQAVDEETTADICLPVDENIEIRPIAQIENRSFDEGAKQNVDKISFNSESYLGPNEPVHDTEKEISSEPSDVKQDNESSGADSDDYDPWSTAVTATSEENLTINDDKMSSVSADSSQEDVDPWSLAVAHNSNGDDIQPADQEENTSKHEDEAKLSSSSALEEASERNDVVMLEHGGFMKLKVTEPPSQPLASWFSVSGADTEFCIDSMKKIEYLTPPLAPVELVFEETITLDLPILRKEDFLPNDSNRNDDPLSPIYPPMSPGSQIKVNASETMSPTREGMSPILTDSDEDVPASLSRPFKKPAEDAPAFLSRPSSLSLASHNEPKPEVSLSSPCECSEPGSGHEEPPLIWSRSMSTSNEEDNVQTDDTVSEIPTAWLTAMEDRIDDNQNGHSLNNEQTENTSHEGSAFDYFTRYIS